ncbi:MAG: PTS-dependent dihydroxyacetone kinase phosphotransferase subunit DhaM, partial [Ktedonobacteraceae bacterium]|nr:PTS-dependent dihydroxyacetone kinase phosphotransferase subunit DhaM [Ktedonobacteraceae bacterium]
MSVGIVVVSHSAQLARGVVELAEQMTQNKTPLAAAGGAEQDILGTSVEKILNAIQQVDSPDGVLVLLDLGSAILSTEMALEILEPEQQAHVRLSHAPLVEGTLNAALEASLGHSLAQVQQAAELTTSDERLRQFKPISQPVGTTLMEPWTIDRGSEPPTPVGTTLMAPEETRSVKASKDVRGVKEEQPEQEVQLTLINPAGLHARPASLFVQTAARFQARVQVSLHGQAANATSIMNVLGLNARQSDTITLSASGPEAEAALTALSELVRAAFHETSEATPAASTAPPPATPPHPPATPPAQETSGTLWRGVVVSPGIAVGAAYLYHSSNLDIQHRSIDEQQVPDEQQRLRTSVEQTIRTLANLSKRVRESIGQDEAGIFEAQALMLQDPTLLDTALDLIAEQRIDAASALSKAGEQQAKLLEELDNELLAARATDVRDVVSRAVRALRGQEQADPAALRQPAILIARDLAPSDTAQLRPELVLGICTSQGGPTAHTAILARSLGIPAIVGLDETALARIRS